MSNPSVASPVSLLLAGCLLQVSSFQLRGEPRDLHPELVSLRECVEMALLHNRAVQVERLNPEIARLALTGSYGYYDPVIAAQIQRERQTDTGGFDPTDFSRDATYAADSEVGSSGLTGLLPSGLSYSLSGGYAHSGGTRNSLNFDSYKLFTGLSVRQPLLRDFWTDQGRTEIRVNKKLVTISECALNYLILDTVNQVQQAYFDLQFTIEHLAVRHRLLATKQASLAGVQRQVHLGALTVLEEKLALSQVARVEAELVAASNTVQQAENALRTLLGHTLTNWNSGPLLPTDRLLVIPEPLELAASWQRGLKQRPDMAQMKADLERAGIDVRFRFNQLFPSLDLVASYGLRGASAVQAIPPAQGNASFSSAFDQIGDRDAPNEMLGVVLSIPLSRARERAAYRASRQLKDQAQLRLKQKEELILREISDALHNARSARDRTRATQRATDFAHAALEAEERKLAGGASSLFFVFQLQSDLADVESAEVRARADYNKALSQLHFAEGSLLERNGLVVKVE